MEILKFHEILSYFKNFLSISFISFNFKINEFRSEATKKKKKIFCRNSQIFCLDLSSANISANVSREPRRTESTSISKIEPFDGASPIIMPFDFDPLSDLAPPPPPCIPCAPLAAPKAFSSNVFRTNVSFLPPTFPRPSRCSFARRGLRTLRDPPTPISIGEFQFISWFLSHASYPTRYSPFRDEWIRNLRIEIVYFAIDRSKKKTLSFRIFFSFSYYKNFSIDIEKSTNPNWSRNAWILVSKVSFLSIIISKSTRFEFRDIPPPNLFIPPKASLLLTS